MIIKVKTFFEEVIAEVKQVNWTKRQDLVNSALVVILSSACLGLFIMLTDLFLSRGLNAIIK